jgi:hypothetical protein
VLTARRALLAALLVVVGVAGSVTMSARPAMAGGIGSCAGTFKVVGGHLKCIVTDPGGGGGGTPVGNPGGGGGGTGPTQCVFNGAVEPCFVAGWGYFNPSDGCYWQAEDPQFPPPASANGEPGTWYTVFCGLFGGSGPVIRWVTSPPPGQPVNPADLARTAVAEMKLHAIAINIVPNAGKTGLVGLPVWMWFAATDQTFGTRTLAVGIPPVRVRATATASKVVWNMGDGDSVTCANTGTPWTPADGAKQSPTCGHVYTQPGKYTVTAATTWHITWLVVGGGPTGDFTVTFSSSVPINISEAQVVTR